MGTCISNNKLIILKLDECKQNNKNISYQDEINSINHQIKNINIKIKCCDIRMKIIKKDTLNFYQNKML